MVIYEILIKILIASSIILSIGVVFFSKTDFRDEFISRLFLTLIVIIASYISYRVVRLELMNIDNTTFKDILMNMGYIIYTMHAVSIFILYLLVVFRTNKEYYSVVVFIAILPTIFTYVSSIFST